MSELKQLSLQANPDLYEWKPKPDEIYYIYDGENVIAKYDEKIGIVKDISTLPIFYLKKIHYKRRMNEIVKYMNYFTRFYDLDNEAFFSTMIVKYKLDKDPSIPQKEFIKLVLDEIITSSFISKCKAMACDLYKLNVNTVSSEKFNNTPKITNAQAFQIVAVSFCFKIITPLMLHFSNIDTNFDPSTKTEYTKWFVKLFDKIIKKFEKDDVKIYTALCRFIAFRSEKTYRNNKLAAYQKKMLHGDTCELHTEDLIKNVVFVKTLYKLDYRKSCVAFMDGVAHMYNTNYLKEKFTSKPYEIDSDDNSKDSDESLSHAEALEMQTYKRDESAAMIADINAEYVMGQMKEWYKSLDIESDELDFYLENFYANEINRFLFENFYNSKFKDPCAVSNLTREETVYLLICLKRIFQYYKMPILSSLCTARVYYRYKENLANNSKFIDEIMSSQEWKQIIEVKFGNIFELGLKDNPIIKTLCNMLSSAYVLVDYDQKIDGYKLDHVDKQALSHEYLMYLTII